MSDTTISLTHVNDAQDIRALVRNAYQHWVAVIGREPMPMRVDYEKAILDHRIDQMRVDGTLVGLIETMVKDDHLWIENIAVNPGHQGKGFGTLLLRHAERLALDAAKPEIRLLTNGAFETNIALYQKNGYRITSTEPFMGGTTIYMSKPLIEQPMP